MATKDVYQLVTDKIVEQLEKGVIPWQRPWTMTKENQAINYVTRKPYSLLNQIMLWEGGEYMTFKQCKKLGGSIKKGAKARIVVFYTTSKVSKRTIVDEETGEERTISVYEDYMIPVLKAYYVFHISDCEGIESLLTSTEKGTAYETTPIDNAEKVITDYLGRESTLKFHNDKPSNRAYYSPSHDEVRIPMITQFKEAEEYYSTAFHELAHSTGIEKRCNRGIESGNSYFGSHNYSKEELVAEISSAFLCSLTGIENEKAFKNSVSYIEGWMRKLKEQKKMFVWAARRADAAVKDIINEKEN